MGCSVLQALATTLGFAELIINTHGPWPMTIGAKSMWLVIVIVIDHRIIDHRIIVNHSHSLVIV